MSTNPNVTISRFVGAAPAEALRGFTQATLLRDWLCDASSTAAHPGGHIFLGWRQGYTAAGTYTRLDLPNALEFTWLGMGDPGPTTLSVTAAPAEGGCRVTLVHGGLGEGPAWEAQAQRWEKEWTAALENLQSVVESGIDLRQARRPRLGIYYDELTPARAAKLGIPGGKGVLLAAAAEGSGAQKAGLVKDDVLVSLNGVALETPGSFDSAMRGLKAGDVLPVEYYRAGEKHTVALELGFFPIPEYPPTGAELAARLSKEFAATAAALRKQVEGLTDAEAGRAPSPGEWSVKELVAHLVLTERDYHAWVANMLNDTPVEDDLRMSPNVTARVKTLAERLGSLSALLNEYETSLAETLAMLAVLPEGFTRDRKHLYRRVAGWASEVTPGHYAHEHQEQISTTIAAVRAAS